jgi:MFS family permease
VSAPPERPSIPTPHRLVTPAFAAISAATLVFYVASGIVVTLAPVFGQEAIGLSKAAVGVAIAVFSVAALVARPVVGWTTDRFGRRAALLIGAALTIAGLLAHLPAGDLLWFAAARSVLGVGEAFWLVAALAAAADLAPEGRRGESLSLLSLTLYLGLAIGPWLAETLLAATGSLATVWVVTALIAAVALALAWLSPETAPGHGMGAEAASGGRAAGDRPRPRLVHPAGLFPGFVIFLGLAGMAYFLSFLPLYARAIGLDGASLPLAEYGLFVVVLRLVGARLPDRLGAVRLSGSALVAAALGLVVIAAWPSLAGLLVGTALFAFGVAFVMPALLALTVARVPAEERGTVVGTATVFLDLSFGIAPVALGAVAEAGGYPLGFVVAGAISALGAVLLVAGTRGARPMPATVATLPR